MTGPSGRSRRSGTTRGAACVTRRGTIGALGRHAWAFRLVLLGTVGCTSGGGGGGEEPTSSLAVLPATPFVAAGQPGGPFDTSAVYTVNNSGAKELFWSASSGASWLAISKGSGRLDPGQSEELTLSINGAFADGLASGLYSTSVGFDDLGRGQTTVLVSATLDIQPGGGSGDLVVSPSTLTLGGPRGGPFDPSSRELVLTNGGSAAQDWTASSDASWLSVSQASGTVAAGAEQRIEATLLASANDLGPGLRTGRVTFREAGGGEVLDELEVTLGVGTTIENRSWLNVHGRPFLPIGVWNQPPWQAQVEYLKSLGFNTYLNNGLTPPEPTNTQLLDLLDENDMWAILQFDPAVKDHPRLLGWLMGDEPDLRNTPVATVQQEFDLIKAADPDHFVALNTTGGFYWDSNFGNPSVEPQYQGYTAIGDIASFDMYPVTGWNQPTWVYMPGAMTSFLLERYVGHAKPVWAIVEASDQGLSWTPPDTPGPSASQMRFEAWDAIIHGATAVHYFTIAFDPFAWTELTPAIEQELMRTNAQITELAEVILAPAPALAVSSSEINGWSHSFMLRQHGASVFLFADNADMGYRSETVTFRFPSAISSVSVHGEGRTITPTGSSFSDVFAPLEVHVYEVRF